MQTTLDHLAIALLPGFTPRMGAALLRRAAADEVLKAPGAHADLLPGAAVVDIRNGSALARAEVQWRRAEAMGVRVLALGDAGYPEWLKQTHDPPPALFVRGTLLGGEGERSVSVVGSRAATVPGQVLGRTLARDLARAGLTVVSGLARGIDAAAHRGALEGGGRTIAVLGSGLSRPYPPENVRLADEIAARGAVVSEFGLDDPPRKSHFPRRNRVIAGWGRAVVVVEAGEKSGALITASLAQDEGREVMAVPGHPLVPASAGTNALLRDGAAVVRDATDVLWELGLETLPSRQGAAPEDDVLGALRPDVPSSLEEIAKRSGRAVPDLLARLGALEVGARVRRLPGPLFVRS